MYALVSLITHQGTCKAQGSARSGAVLYGMVGLVKERSVLVVFGYVVPGSGRLGHAWCGAA